MCCSLLCHLIMVFILFHQISGFYREKNRMTYKSNTKVQYAYKKVNIETERLRISTKAALLFPINKFPKKYFLKKLAYIYYDKYF